ncbi:CtsR family transcriptional regulator [Hathewaya massiliensis]|uniref:CtsR family transcriptional regulator n=1 Tax=Hathewaya massiliensis TaxID=1964382 RepID=UPI001159C9E6|nr:CtsR family transcriptional regulator [Hathewaya massiliensis]
MARLSDIIENFIKDMMKESEDLELEIQRNELANYFSCAPSQINYVLTTRFTTEHGYIVESRRGGGGCIRIRKVEITTDDSYMDLLNEKIGHSITYDNSIKIVENLLENGIITHREGNIIKAALNDRSLNKNYDYRNHVRADILKSIMLSLLI